MIIGIDASRANKTIKTGVEWYSYHLIQALKLIDQENRYFLYTNKSLTGELACLPNNFHQALLKWPPVRLWTLLRLSLSMKFGRYRPHVLFVPAHTIPLLTPARTVVTIHDIGFERFPELYKFADRAYHKLAIKFIKKKADKIITISEFSKQELIDVYGIAPERIAVIPNGYNQRVYQPLDLNQAREQVRAKFKLTAPYLMFIGRLEAKKNIIRLVEAFGEFKKKYPSAPHQLVLAGKKGYMFEQAEMMIDNYHLQESVVCLGYVSEADAAWLMNAAELFVFPSLYEGFGIPVLEAMACGCPVICSNTTALPEVAGQAAIKFNPENIEAMVKAMAAVIWQPEVRTALIQAGLEQCQKFTWEQCARRTLEVLAAE